MNMRSFRGPLVALTSLVLLACGTKDPGAGGATSDSTSDSTGDPSTGATVSNNDGVASNTGNAADPLPTFDDVEPSDSVETAIEVDAGEFAMGCASQDGDCRGDENPFRIVTLEPFEIQKYEVTVAQYRACVEDGGCSEPGEGELCNYDRFEYHPINCVDWQQAYDYCDWLGWRLPTEAEWERAARGAAGLIWPWGNQEATCDYAIMKYCSADGTAPVGSLEAGTSADGAMDMAGNVWEWINDWYSVDYYLDAPTEDPVGPDEGDRRMVRGGGYTDVNPASLRTSYRGAVDPANAHHTFGMRCAR